MNDMRKLIRIVEEHGQPVSYYAHVSPGKNLSAILRRGLRPNVGGGNYAGYEEALNGVYVTRVPNILRSHINARFADDHYVIVVVVVESEAFIDEDVIHDLLDRAATKVLGNHGLTIRGAVDELDPDDVIWKEIVPVFVDMLGEPKEQTDSNIQDAVSEYVESWILHEVYGEDVDPTYWAPAKDEIVRAFPNIEHPVWGPSYSLRIPQAIGYKGLIRIIAVIDMKDGSPKIVKGDIPPTATNLLSAVTGTLNESVATTAPKLYHGTSLESAMNMVKNGWEPRSGQCGGNMGQPRYLYLSTGYEDALWFAVEKGCDTVLEVTDVPLDYLKVDPEDGISDSLEDELNLSHGLPGKVVLTKPLSAHHFRIIRR